MLNLTAGVYNIDTESVEALINVHPEAYAYMPKIYGESNTYAFWMKNESTGDISIVTGNKNIREVRNAITALLSS